MSKLHPQLDTETKKFLTDFKSIIDSLEVPIFIGRNIQNKFKSETINKIKQIVEIILGQDTYISQCMPKILDVEEWDETFDKIVKRFESLQYGLTKEL